MIVDSCVILCGGKSSRLRGANGESKILLPFGKDSLITRNFKKMRGIFKCVFIACKDNQRDLIEKSLVDSHESAQFFTHPLAPSAREGESAELLRTREGESNVDSHESFESNANPRDIFIIESTTIFAPLVGIITAFTQLQSQKIFFISCDCPFVSPHTIESLCDESQNYDIVFAKDSRKIHPLIAVWSKNTLPFLQDSLKKGDFRLRNIIENAHAKAIDFGDSNEFLNINTPSDYNRAIQILG